MRQAARVDQNQADIVEALRTAGALVLPLHTVGHGCPDALCQFRGALYLLEIKATTGSLTGEQEAFQQIGWSVAVVRTPEEALAAIGAI